MKPLSFFQGDAEVAPECLSRSLVIRKERDSLERALEAKERIKRMESRERRERDHCGLHHHLIIAEQCL